jgi:hypothetical protein
MHQGQPVDLAVTAELMRRIETEVPVAEWRVAGIAVWPLVRMRIGYALAYAGTELELPSRSVGMRAFPSRTVAAARTCGRVAKAAIAGRRPTLYRERRIATGPRGSAVMMSDGISFERRDRGWVDRHCVPISDALERTGCTTLLLVPGSAAPYPIAAPVRYIQPELDLATARARFKRPPPSSLPGYEGVTRILVGEGAVSALPSQRDIVYFGAILDACACRIGRHLSRVKPLLGLVVEYYALRGMAFVLACHRAGIPSVDIQHGVEGDLHFAYGGWRVPPSGYSLLPRYFWVWSECEAATIAAWSNSTDAHSAIVGGNPSLQRWLDGEGPDREAADRQIGARLHGLDVSRNVLVALQGTEGSAEIERVLAWIRNAPARWFWWIRCHPARDEISHTRRAVTAAGITNAEVDLATTLPLYALLRRVDVHVTGFSSVVIDAAIFGVPSVVTSPLGSELFGREVAEGRVAEVVGSDPAAVVSALANASNATALDSRRGENRAAVRRGLQWVEKLAGGGARPGGNT